MPQNPRDGNREGVRAVLSPRAFAQPWASAMVGRSITSCARLVASDGAGVREGRPGYRDELPLVASGIERQLEHAERIVAADLAVRRGRPGEPVVTRAARTDHELPKATPDVQPALGILRSE